MTQRPHDTDSPTPRATLQGPPHGWVAAVRLIGLMGCGAASTPKDASRAAASGDVHQNDSADITGDAGDLAATYAAQRAAILADPFIDIAHRGGRKLWPEHTTIAYDGSVALGVEVDAAFVALCKQVGLRIQPWTINDPKRMQALIDLGVHGMFTDDPASLRALLGAR